MYNKKIMNLKYFSIWSYNKKAIATIIVFFIIKIIVSGFLNLGNDESYYWTFSKQLQWNYFDHPPMVALWVRFFTVNLWLEDYVFFLRLGSFIGCAVSSFFIYKAVSAISSEKAGFVGVFLYNISFYASITAGLFIMPDTPQMVFWTASMYWVTQIIEDEKKILPWVLFAVCAGLTIMSKVHGVFLWGGVFLYAVFYRLSWFKNKGFYIAAAITALVISPILIWNIENDFITYRFHSERVMVNNESVLNFIGLLREIIGQLVINNPFTIGLIIIFYSKKYNATTIGAIRVFKLMGIPLLIVIFFISIFRTTLPHWSGPAYISLLPIAAIGLAEINTSSFKLLIKSAKIYVLIFMLLLIGAVNFYPATFGSKNEKELGKNDISLDAYGWKEAGEKFAAYYIKQHNDNTKPPLLCNTWWGGHDEYYFARPLGIKMIGLGNVLNIHQYAWRLGADTLKLNMDTAYTVVHSYDYFDVKKAFEKHYATIDSVQTIPVLRSGKRAYYFNVWRLTGWKKIF